MTKIAISIKNLTVKFGDFKAVDDVSFDINEGEVFGFLGANGAGKTTTIRVLCGLLDPTSGSVNLNGLELYRNRNAIKEMVGYMSQKFTLYEDLTVGENMSFKASLRSMDSGAAKKKRDELLEFIGFGYPLGTLVRDLPSGVKQQVSLAASLLHDPQVVFLDEPTSGVSPIVRVKFWELIRSLADKGKTVIVTTHYMDEAEQCGRIALMREGKLIALDSPEGLKKSAYKQPIAEVNLGEISKEAKQFFKRNEVTSWWPYGLKFHAVLRTDADARSFITSLPAGVTAKIIKPSLEDVFIKLVEHNPSNVI
jgi:ABC-2 type transport system ATP-binding protein